VPAVERAERLLHLDAGRVGVASVREVAGRAVLVGPGGGAVERGVHAATLVVPLLPLKAW